MVALVIVSLAPYGGRAKCNGVTGNVAWDKPSPEIIIRGDYPGMPVLCDSLGTLFADVPDSMKDSATWLLSDAICGVPIGCCLEVTWLYDSLDTAQSPLDRLRSWLFGAGWKYRSDCSAEGPGVSESTLERGKLYCLLRESGGIGDLEDTLSTGDGINFFRACFVPKDSTDAR